nr:hypothetical protein [Halomonas venusta]
MPIILMVGGTYLAFEGADGEGLS